MGYFICFAVWALSLATCRPIEGADLVIFPTATGDRKLDTKKLFWPLQKSVDSAVDNGGARGKGEARSGDVSKRGARPTQGKVLDDRYSLSRARALSVSLPSSLSLKDSDALISGIGERGVR